MTTAIGAAFKRAKRTVQGESSERLSDALLKIEVLRKRFSEIAAELEKHSRRFTDHVEQSRKKFEQSKSLEDELAWLNAEMISDWHRKRSADPAAEARRFVHAVQTGRLFDEIVFERLSEEQPSWRKPF